MAFEGLTEKLNATFKKLRGKGRLTENDVREAMREVRLALLEADVGYKVVKDFVATVTERAVGRRRSDGTRPPPSPVLPSGAPPGVPPPSDPPEDRLRLRRPGHWSRSR